MAAKKCLLCFRGSVLLPRPLLLLIHMGKNCKYVCAARKALVYRIFEAWCGMKGWGTRLQRQQLQERRNSLNFLGTIKLPWWFCSQRRKKARLLFAEFFLLFSNNLKRLCLQGSPVKCSVGRNGWGHASRTHLALPPAPAAWELGITHVHRLFPAWNQIKILKFPAKLNPAFDSSQNVYIFLTYLKKNVL